MQPFAFTASRSGELHRYEFLADSGGIVASPNWPVLLGNWSTLARTPFDGFAVNNNNTEEIAVYLGFVWQLVQGRALFATPAFYREKAARGLGREPLLVRWEFEVAADEPRRAEREKGFVKARSSTPIPARADQRAHRDRAGLFRVENFQELVGLMQAVLGDASAELTLFALDEAHVEALTATLNGRREPSITDLVKDDDLMVDITVGVDLGYVDSLLVYSAPDLEQTVSSLARRFELALRAYETRVVTTRSADDMLKQLEQLAAGLA